MTEQGVFGRIDLDDELAHVTALVGVQVPGRSEEGRERRGATRRVNRRD